MADYQAPLRFMRFLLHDVFKAETYLADLPEYEDFNRELLDAILDEAANFSTQVLLPINASGDAEGCTWQDGKVTTPKGFKDAFKQYCESGWSAMGLEADYGGQPVPKSLHLMVEEMLCACNTAFALYPNLTSTAALLLQYHANQELKDTYLSKMISGEWMGTMCLTESHAGSDLGIIKTTATPNGDDSYAITGTKIFISAGEHDLADNIIHLVLAKMPDAPAGSKGISLFLVPKVLPNDSGDLGDLNNVSCGSIEHKMGIKASATAVMNFDGAKGYLVGEVNQGLRCMFTMMNSERLSVGMQGVGLAETSTQSAVAYALDRKQGRTTNDPTQLDSIIKHGDVRRMLLSMMSMTSGCRILTAYIGQQYDISEHHADSEQRKRATGLVALLTPVTKAYFTDRALETCSTGIQVLGGHGYVQEWGMEQLMRDTRITQIYEGTNGIQSLDLLGRKILGDKGVAWSDYKVQLHQMINQAQQAGYDDALCNSVADSLEALDDITSQLIQTATPDLVSSVAVDYMNFFGTVSIAAMWLKCISALPENAAEEPFYEQQLALARFFIEYHLPTAQAAKARIQSGAGPVMNLSESGFAVVTEVN